jgi:DnaJ-class molecular chaperone
MKCKKCKGTGYTLEYMIGPGDPSYVVCKSCNGSKVESIVEIDIDQINQDEVLLGFN